MIEKNLFSIPIWSMQVKNFKDKKKQLNKLFKLYPEKRQGLQTFETNRQIDRKNLSINFSNIIKQELELFVEKVKRNIQIEDVWSISYKKEDYHSTHNHGSVGLTGILYLDMPKNAPVTQYIQPWNNFINDTTLYHPFPVTEGTMIIAPKFVQHFTTPNKSKKIKRVISWDMKVI
jgi:hypothetical protein